MVKKGTCGLCQGGCAVVYTIEDGKIVKAEPDKRISERKVMSERSIGTRYSLWGGAYQTSIDQSW